MNLFRVAGVAAAVLGMSALAVSTEPMFIGYLDSDMAKVSHVDLAKYTHINIAFGIPDADGSITLPADIPLATTVKAIQDKKVKALLSVGGWTGSKDFSDIVKDTAKSKKFIASMVDVVKTAGLDGIDIDWEYPGKVGNKCNVVDAANDSDNYLVFLGKLKDAFTANFGAGKKLITMAVAVTPFMANDKPMTDVSAFAEHVDFANIMLYDINGVWNDVTGPNAPLDSPADKGGISFKSGIDAWIDAKWPANQLTAGVAFYGRTMVAKGDMSKDPKNQYQPQTKVVTKGDEDDAPWEDKCAGTTSLSGVWKWNKLRKQHVLTAPDTAGAGWTRYWDDVSQTPWLFNTANSNFISYDDPKSLEIKAAYAAQKGLAGMMVWSMKMDSDNELLDAIHTWPGKTTCDNPPCDDTQLIDSSSSEPSTDDSTPTDTSPADDDDDDDGNDGNDDELPDQEPLGDGTCSENGKFTCVDSGNSSEFHVCNFNSKVSMKCAPGTKCYTLGPSIVCAVTDPQT
ncbi:hypothetical protein IWQ57_002126 [Coemansia nantahalensis]|uniref:Uncharacterized protein n=1 Tax=Coemansia nantahalensis TaxID=2789366 RepID=A0ACC1K1P1_9FUNG|nr:hypothetical protein IWQ57_002126 [Coemansia nantahalensis]